MIRDVAIIDCEVVQPPYLRCNGCGQVSYILAHTGRIHDCPARGAWQLITPTRTA